MSVLLAMSAILSGVLLMVFDFSNIEQVDAWSITDDGVMGGISQGHWYQEDYYVVFDGNVSLENNGGFSSLRFQPNPIVFENKSKALITVKGDGKNYQFRIKERKNDYASYISTFSTSGKWETIEIPLKDLYPSWRGRKLQQPNYAGNRIEEITFLIANKTEESFKLEIEKIELK
jgi:NADH dehydrogenase [ubiquinone] 1 alpha subcomplex assembly factor 1